MLSGSNPFSKNIQTFVNAYYNKQAQANKKIYTDFTIMIEELKTKTGDLKDIITKITQYVNLNTTTGKINVANTAEKAVAATPEIPEAVEPTEGRVGAEGNQAEKGGRKSKKYKKSKKSKKSRKSKKSKTRR